MAAALQADPRCVERLLRCGSNPNERNTNFRLPAEVRLLARAGCLRALPVHERTSVGAWQV